MKYPSSKAYFIITDKRNELRNWYGYYDYNTRCYSWSKIAVSIKELNFNAVSTNEPSLTTLEELSKNFKFIYISCEPFDYNYLQTYYPEYLI